MAFKMKNTALYKRYSKRNSCAFKKNHDDNRATIDTTLADNIYSADRVNKSLRQMGYDPASRTTYGKTGWGGKINKNKVSKVNQDIYNAPDKSGGMVPLPTDGYMGGQF